MLKLILSCAIASALTQLMIPRALAQTEECGFLTSPQELNTFETEDRVVIGQVSDRPYIVLLTEDVDTHLSTVRTCIPDAFLTSSRLGRYVHVASFKDYRDAKILADNIKESLNLDVRVIHHNRLGRR